MEKIYTVIPVGDNCLPLRQTQSTEPVPMYLILVHIWLMLLYVLRFPKLYLALLSTTYQVFFILIEKNLIYDSTWGFQSPLLSSHSQQAHSPIGKLMGMIPCSEYLFCSIKRRTPVSSCLLIPPSLWETVHQTLRRLPNIQKHIQFSSISSLGISVQ